MPSNSLTVTAELDSLAIISEFVNTATRQAKMSEREAWQVQLAVDEAATNIIQHAYADIDTGSIDIVWQITAGELIVVLTDHGKPFEPSLVPTPDITSPFEERQGGGLGIYLMNKLMDDVSYTFNTQGNILTLRKRFAEAAVADPLQFHLEGRLDARGTVSALTPVNQAVAAGARTLLLNFAQVSFLSSSGLRALLLVRREINERHGVLKLVDLQPQVEEVFTLTGFAQIFEIHRTMQEALAAINDRGDGEIA